MDVYWLEQSEADLPTGDDWLSPSEVAWLDTMRFAKRRSDWKLGRWTAKNALALYFLPLNVPVDPQLLTRIEIWPAPSGAPEAFFQGRPATATISLSHRAGVAACAIACSSGVLGCDLETIEPRSEAFVADYFTTAEQSFLANASATDHPRLLALLWSAKESALKALRQGLRLDLRSVVVSPPDAVFDMNGWSPIAVRHSDDRIFCGWWQHADGMVRTLVAVPLPNPPIRLLTMEHLPSRLPCAHRCGVQGK
jgi:4'-phosphopantetheinyl transferase